MTYHDVPLPDSIEQGSSFGPGFKTSIIALSSGFEQRNQDWEQDRCKGDIGYGLSTKDDYSLWLAHFRARRGRLHSWPFKDWSDFEGTDENIGTGNGIAVNFQLRKVYESSGPDPYYRPITRPITGTIVVKVNNIVNANWTLGSLGMIVFNSGFAPGNGLAVTASFEFDVPVRYDVDEIGLELKWEQAGQVRGIMIVEDKEI